MTSHYVGIDIALKTATVAWQVNADTAPSVIDITQDAQGYSTLVKQLRTLNQAEQIHIVMEATSTYWMDLALTLYEAGFLISVVNPSQPKYFAKMQLQRAKTDAIDAVMLMHYAQSQVPDLWSPPLPSVSNCVSSSPIGNN